MDSRALLRGAVILLWGATRCVEPSPLVARAEAKRRGAKIIAIDPYRSLFGREMHAARGAAARTDGAHRPRMMHVLIART